MHTPYTCTYLALHGHCCSCGSGMSQIVNAIPQTSPIGSFQLTVRALPTQRSHGERKGALSTGGGVKAAVRTPTVSQACPGAGSAAPPGTRSAFPPPPRAGIAPPTAGPRAAARGRPRNGARGGGRGAAAFRPASFHWSGRPVTHTALAAGPHPLRAEPRAAPPLAELVRRSRGPAVGPAPPPRLRAAAWAGPGRAGSAWRERSGFGTNWDGPGPATSGTWRACGRAGGPPRAGRGPARGPGLRPSRRCSRRGCTVSTANAAASIPTSPTRSRSPPSSSTGEAAWMGPGSRVELGGAVGPAPCVG